MSTTTSMSFIVNRSAMSNALNTLTPSISTRATLPILSNVLIVANEQGITVSTTNLEIGTRIQINNDACTVVETGSLTVKFSELLALVKSIKDEEVYFSEMSTSQSETVLLIEATGVHVSKSSMDSSEYPLIPVLSQQEMQGLPFVTLPVETLRNMIKLVTHAAADDYSRPVLTGVNVHLENDRLTFAAADAFRLAVITEKIDGAGTWLQDVLIPATTLEAVSKQLPKAKKNVDLGNITITVNESRSQTTFTREGYTLVTRNIDGTYPRYQVIIPHSEDAKCMAECEVTDLKNAVELVKPAAKDSSNITRFMVNGHIDVKATSEETELQAEVPAQTTNSEGETTEIILNNKYVSDLLSVHPQGTVVWELQGPTKPAKFTYPDIPGFVEVIMPMHLNR